MPWFLNPANLIFRSSTQLVRYYFNFQNFYLPLYIPVISRTWTLVGWNVFFPSSTPTAVFQRSRHFRARLFSRSFLVRPVGYGVKTTARAAAIVFSTYKLQQILFYFFQGYKSPTIARLLRKKDGMVACRRHIAKFLAKYREMGSIGRRSGSGRPSKLTREVKVFIKEQMRHDNKTTAHQLHRLLHDREYSLSLRTILCCQTSTGRTFRGSSYCQLIWEPNKIKHLEWARKHINDDFDDVIWTDECSVQLQTHHCFYCRKEEKCSRVSQGMPMSTCCCFSKLLP